MPHAYDPWSHHNHHAPVEEEETEGEVTGGEETEAEVTEEEDEPCESGVTQLNVDFTSEDTPDYEFYTFAEDGARSVGFGEVVVGSEIFILGPRFSSDSVWNEPSAAGLFTFSYEGINSDR